MEVIPKVDRVEKVKNSIELNDYSYSQKNVINEILNVYQNKSVIELENIRMLEVKNFNKQLLVNMDSYQHPFSILVNSFRNDATDDIDWNRMYKYIKDNYANIRITQVIKASDEDEKMIKEL